MRGITVVNLDFPGELHDPDLQVKCLTYIVQNAKDIYPKLPEGVKLFVTRGRTGSGGKEIPLLGLQERTTGRDKTGWNSHEALDKLQRWIDEQDPAALLDRIASTNSPTFADLDDRKK